MLFRSSQQIQIIPNPNNGVFTIQLLQKQRSTSKIEIINLTGQVVFSDELYSGQLKKEISLPQSMSGLYTCRIINNEKVFQSLFIVR